MFDLKQEVSGFLTKIGLFSSIKAKENEGNLIISSAKKEIGQIKSVEPSLLKVYGIEFPCYVAEFSINVLSEILSRKKEAEFTPIPKYPPFEFDFAVIVDQSVSAGSLMSAIKNRGGNTLQSLDIFDVFEGESIGLEKKSIAFRLKFLDHNKTLNIKEVEPIINRIVKELNSKFGAQLRG